MKNLEYIYLKNHYGNDYKQRNNEHGIVGTVYENDSVGILLNNVQFDSIEIFEQVSYLSLKGDLKRKFLLMQMNSTVER